MHYTDDPAADAAERDYDFEEWLKRRPICDECGEPIRSDNFYEFDGVLFCEDCIEEHRHSVEEYME